MKYDIKSVNNTFFKDKGDWFFGPPSEPGVYAIAITPQPKYAFHEPKERILYIGSSVNIKKRILAFTHPYRKIYDRFSDNNYVYFFIAPCENYKELEKVLISIYRPLLNKQYINYGKAFH